MKKRTTASFTWLVSLIVCIALLTVSAGCSSSNSNNNSGNSSNTNSNSSNSSNSSNGDNESKTDDLSDIAEEYTLSAGYYTAGIDIPVGKANVIAVSGSGNLSSSNMYSGGVNEIFGIDDGSGFYTSEFNNLALAKNVRLKVTSNLVVKLTYTNIEAGFTGRTYDEDNAIELTSGNYTAGTDFPAGIYTINAVSGSGNINSSNMFSGGLNEVFGVDTSSSIYTDQFINVELDDGVTLTVSGGLTVKLTPAK